jgi:hypothetical protein
VIEGADESASGLQSALTPLGAEEVDRHGDAADVSIAQACKEKKKNECENLHRLRRRFIAGGNSGGNSDIIKPLGQVSIAFATVLRIPEAPPKHKRLVSQ